ncbi:SDR family oxidoreductase [Salipiger aestuarii]|uniref:SDR family oxidoreductase n=1 Tax=Salipiger aestuarii TaxID=568098 RepID=UPI00123923FA|nr:SDR family oxidoreductase [Salipiger aestuarii]KAA8616416.1 epimerase [Salipiger aestuarii]
MKNVLLSLGHGYSAQALADRLLPLGWKVLGTTRDPAKADRMRARGMTPVAWTREAVSAALNLASHLLISAGPGPDGDPSLALAHETLAARAPDLTWAGYLSTTGVYGDHAGGWIDENAALDPSTRRGRLRVEAETAWQAIPDLPLHIFRLAGIYGPGRGPFAKVRGGTARRIVKPGQVFSRIHAADIAQSLEASIRRPQPGGIYNLCDDAPAPPQDVILFACELLGVTPPAEEDFATAEMTSMARSFYAESKRVSNRRLKEDLGVRLMYPDYRTGLRALLAEEGLQGA